MCYSNVAYKIKNRLYEEREEVSCTSEGRGRSDAKRESGEREPGSGQEGVRTGSSGHNLYYATRNRHPWRTGRPPSMKKKAPPLVGTFAEAPPLTHYLHPIRIIFHH